jgi:hypothetical protein
MTDERHRDQHAGDAAIDAAWRGASRDVPSAQVDAAILAAARAEVRRPAAGRRAPVRQAWWHAWQPLAAAAGVAGLAFVLVQVLPREPGVRTPQIERAPRVDSAVPEASAPQVGSAIPEATAPQVGSAAPRDDALRTDRGEAQPEAEVAISAEAIAGAATDAAAAVASVPAPASAPTPAPAPAAELRSGPRQESAAADRSALADAAPPAAKQSAAAELAPEQWATHIAALYEAGHVAAAAAELRAFRQAYADADDRLTPALRAWAASVHTAEAP